MGIGFTLALFAMGSIREILGNGTWMSGAEWLDYEPLSDTQILVSMAKPEAEQASYGMLQFMDGSWNMKCIVYCTPAF